MRLSKSIRVRRGVVYTPDNVAASICELISNDRSDTGMLSVLEPSAGDGVFLRGLESVGFDQSLVTAVDVSKVAAKTLFRQFPSAEIITQDFIKMSLLQEGRKFDIVVGNPPYVRRHNFTVEQKASIQALADASGYPIASMKNAWAAFVVAGCRLLSEGGSLAFVVPYEFLTVQYGKKLQEWILEHVGSLEIFIPKSKAFPDIEQDAVLMTIKCGGVSHRMCLMHHVESLSELSGPEVKTFDVTGNSSCPIEQNRFLLGDETAQIIQKLKAQLPCIADICDTATGTVTAANEFFILSKKEVAENGFEPWAKPILKKASYLPNSVRFTQNDFDDLAEDEPCYLVNFGNGSEDALASAALEYIEKGEVYNFHERYKCKRRKPWYNIPETAVAEGLFFKRSHLFPRLIMNDARVQVTDTAYRLSLKAAHTLRGLSFSYYNSLSLLFSEIYGRFYGGGVLELTPNEFRQVPICYVEPTDAEFAAFECRIVEYMDSPRGTFDYGDTWLRERLQLSVSEMLLVQEGLTSMRDHRLRHSGKKQMPS